MTRSTALETSAHALDLHSKSGIAEALFEFPILARRPDGECSAGFQCAAYVSQSGIVVEAGVDFGREWSGAIVDIEQNGIEPGGIRLKRERNVIHVHVHPFILKRVSSQWT